jgi:formyltetrahydrofolate-dependent phosphoribosylglycinamide formyltransferase
VPPRLVVLASGSGSTLQAILDDPELRARVVGVGSDRRDATALVRAARAGVDTFVVPFADYADRGEWNRAVEKALADRVPDLVVLAGFMRILDAELVGRFRMVNTHPALLPAFPGAHAIRDALAAGVASTGVTVHWVDAGVDTGPVIVQQSVPVEPGDDEDSLRERLQAVEKPLFVNAIRSICQEMSR